MVELEALGADDAARVAELLDEHIQRTGSAKAKRLLNAWEETLGRFVKVVPTEYRKVLEQLKQHPAARATRDSLRVLRNDDPLSGEAQAPAEAVPVEAE
jgi:glutamate synthase domain-containing protein 3